MSTDSYRRRARGGANTVMVVAALLVVGTGILAYKYIFHRAGEEAISLLPADSLVVATADLGPGPGQVELFAHIARAMINEKIDDPLASAASMSTNGAAYLKSIRPYLGLSYAFGCWKKAGSKKDDDLNYVGLAAVKNTSDVEAASAQHGVLAQSNGLSYYRITGEKMCVTTIKQYLVMADDPSTLLKVRDVAYGDSPSVASQRDYVDARSKLPRDANVMVFLNMNTASAAARARFNIQNSDAASAKGWMAGGATLRNTGIEIVWSAPTDSSNPLSHLVASIKPIDSSLYNRLPEGAFGVIALAQPGGYYPAKDLNLGLTSDQKKQFQDGLDSFEKETGLNIQRDVIPGLTGNLTLAVYPSNSTSTEIPDGLIMLDDANGSDPAAMVEKIKAVIAGEARKNHSIAPTYRSEQRDGATIWTMDDETEKALRAQSGIAKRPGDSTGVARSDTQALATKSESKLLIFAVNGKSVMIASSRSLIDRTLSSYTTGKSSLASDPAYMTMLKQITAGSQQVVMIGVPVIMEHLRNVMSDSMSDPTGPKPDDVIKLFGAQGNGLVFSQGCADNRASGILFIPIDYDRAIHLVGLQKSTRKGAIQ